MENLIKWLNKNKIQYTQIDNDVVDIAEFGLMYLADTSAVNSILRNDQFNLSERAEVLIEEGINYAAFHFGNNFFYYDLREPFQFNILKYIGCRQPATNSVQFVNLGVHTPYELLNASGSISNLVCKAKHLGHTAIGICDYNTMAGTLNLQKECKARGIKPVFGYSLTAEYMGNKVGMKVYALSQNGLQNLLKIQKAIMVDSANHTIELNTLTELGDGCVLVIEKREGRWLSDNKNVIPRFLESFEKVHFQVDLNEYKAERIDNEVLESTATFFENFMNPLTPQDYITPILICDSYYLDREDARNKIVLNKIAVGAAHEQSEEQYFKDVDEHYNTMETLFSDKWNFPELFEQMCRATMEIAQSATAEYEVDRNFMPRYDMTEKEKERYKDRHNMFLSLLEEGFRQLVPEGKIEEYRKRLDKEIYVIESTDNIDYLLVQWDTVNWARQNDILVGCGRGSAGGSLILYLLGITLIDPIKYNLLFERFLLPERAGLYPSQVTKLDGEFESTEYVEIKLENNKKIKLDKDAKLLVKRDGTRIKIYADELKEDDDIILDHRDLLWGTNQPQ